MIKWFFAAAASLTAAVSPASASTYLFTVTGSDSASFILPSAPTVSSVDPFGQPGFRLSDVAGSFVGADGGYTSTARLDFFSSRFAGLEASKTSGSSIFHLFGDQLYSGTTDSPTFTPGTYDLRNNYYGTTNNDHLTVTDITNFTGYLFTVTGSDSASFILPSAPTVSSVDPFGQPGFRLSDVAGSFVGADGGYTSTARLDFFSSRFAGLEVSDTSGSSIFHLFGDQLYSGTTDSPTFTPGTYDLRNNYYGTSNNDHLTITALVGAPAAVPEAETWFMMILGMGLLGCTMRHARSTSRMRLSKC